jgi:catechol 2,3-dioxygenase-like lactoylglutathione lyase family enzyme
MIAGRRRGHQSGKGLVLGRARRSPDAADFAIPTDRHPAIRTQEDPVTPTKARISKINTVVIPVSDQERATEFYVEKLGFEKRVDVPFGNGMRWIEVAPAGAETTIALAPPPEGAPTGDRETGIGLQTDDIDAYHAELEAAGVDVDAEVSRMGGPVPPLFWLRDPERNQLMVVELS